MQDGLLSLLGLVVGLMFGWYLVQGFRRGVMGAPGVVRAGADRAGKPGAFWILAGYNALFCLGGFVIAVIAFH